MKKNLILGVLGTFIFAGCAGQTTDPRQGGLFSYDPSAYEQRISDRENHLNSINNDTAVQKNKNKKLKNNYNSEKRKLNNTK